MSPMVLRHCSVLASLALLVAVAPAQGDLTWRGEPRAIESLDGCSAAATAVIRSWLPYAREQNGRLVLSDDRRVLLVLGDNHARQGRTERKSVEKLLRSAAATLAATDRFLPPIGDEPLVIVSTRTQDYPRLLGHVAVLEPRLGDWAATMAGQVSGFVLSEPPVAAWIEDPRDVEEWRPENEVVHRLAQLTLRSRGKGLPDWLLVGLAWHVEDAVCGGIYCFPNRSSFVSVNEHTGWGQRLGNLFKPSARKKAGRAATLQIDEFAGWRAGASGTEYSDGTANTVFGLARYLATEHAQALPRLVSALAEAHESGSKVWVSQFEWTTDPTYRVPDARQLELLSAVDPRLLAKATAWFVQKKAGDRRLFAARG